MLILIDKANLKMLAAASNRKWINLVAYVDYPDHQTVIADGQEGRTWSVLTKEEMAKLYCNVSQLSEAPAYGECVKQLSAYVETWPNYPKSEESLLVEAEKIYAEEQAALAQRSPEEVAADEALAKQRERENHQAIIAGNEKARAAMTPEQRATASAAIPGASAEPKERKAADPGAAPKQGVTKRIWEIADDLLAVQGGNVGDIKKFRLTVTERAVAEGANAGTCGTQFGKWKAARGIK